MKVIATARWPTPWPGATTSSPVRRRRTISPLTLARDDIDVVDITTHPAERPPLIETALTAGKHVLSQKPFVLDLDVGRRLADLADAAA